MRALFLFPLIALAQTPTPPPLVSPDVHADHTVTFRFRDPNAKAVRLSLEGTTRDPKWDLTVDDKGIWSITTTPLEPDYYGYTFNR